MTRARRREALAFYLCISPWLIGFIFLTVGPMLYSLYISFTRWDLLTDPVWVGLRNYTVKMPNDERFWQSLKVTVLYTLAYVPLELIGGLALALLVQSRIRGIRVFRTIFYLPTVLAGVAFVVVWLWMLDPRGGLVNLLLAQFGIVGPRWLLDPDWALPALIMMSFWGWGRAMVIYLAGLQAIPGELYEAAAIDGAGSWTRFWRVTIPAADAHHLLQPDPEHHQHLPDPSPTPLLPPTAARWTPRSSTCSTCTNRPSSSAPWATPRRWPGCSS